MIFEERIVKKLSISKSSSRIKIKEIETIKYPDLFYLKKGEKYDFVKHRMITLEHNYLELLEIEEFSPVNFVSETSFHIMGIITGNTDKKLGNDNVFICSLIDNSNGVRVKLNLRYLKHFSLFPGQIVAITGKNVKGDEIIVQKIHTLPFFDYNSDIVANYQEVQNIYTESPVLINIISGPFSNDYDYDFLDQVLERDGDCFILIGPFVDKMIPGLDPNNIFFEIILPKLEKWLLKSMTSKIIIVPSVLDINTIGIFPQEKFNYQINNERIYLVSNPARFFINEMMFGCCSFDNLFNMGKEEFSFENKSAKAWQEDKCSEILFKTDRIDRLCTHYIFQQSFLPVFPLNEPINFNPPSNVDIKIIPDFLIICSLFKEFERKIGPATVINVGAKRKIGNKKLICISVSQADKNADEDEDWLRKRTKIDFVQL